MPPKRKITKDFFDEDDDEPDSSVEVSSVPTGFDDEIDPLDQFMSTVDQQLQVDAAMIKDRPQVVSQCFDDEDRDDEWMNTKCSERSSAIKTGYDLDNDALGEKEKCRIEPLAPIDHSMIHYQPFKKKFYEVKDVLISPLEVQQLRKRLQIQVLDESLIVPVSEFAQAGVYPDVLVHVICSPEHTQCTISSVVSALSYTYYVYAALGFPIELLNEITKLGLSNPIAGTSNCVVWSRLNRLG